MTTDSGVVPLGIPEIDAQIRGGVPRGRGYMIRGNTLSGKTVLALHIQYAAMERGETCIFVTLSQPFWRIVEYYESFRTWDIKKHINAGRLFISDVWSRGYVNASLVDDRLRTLEARGYGAIREATHFLEEPDNPELYIQHHVDIFKKKGPGGANMIDALSDQFQFADDPENIMKIHKTAREVFASPEYQGTGFHLYTPEHVIEPRATLYSSILDGFEDGTIEIRTEYTDTGSRRHLLRIAGIRGWCGSTGWYEFVVDKDMGIRIVRTPDQTETLSTRGDIRMDKLKSLRARARSLPGRLADLKQKDDEGQLDEGRILRMRTTIETDLFATLDAIAELVGDDAFCEIAAEIRDKETEASVQQEIDALSKKSGWSDLGAVISKYGDRMIDLAITIAIRAADQYIKTHGSGH